MEDIFVCIQNRLCGHPQADHTQLVTTTPQRQLILVLQIKISELCSWSMFSFSSVTSYILVPVRWVYLLVQLHPTILNKTVVNHPPLSLCMVKPRALNTTQNCILSYIPRKVYFFNVFQLRKYTICSHFVAIKFFSDCSSVLQLAKFLKHNFTFLTTGSPELIIGKRYTLGYRFAMQKGIQIQKC